MVPKMTVALLGLAVSGAASAGVTGYDVVGSTGNTAVRYEATGVLRGAMVVAPRAFNLQVASTGAERTSGAANEKESTRGVLTQQFGVWATRHAGQHDGEARPFDAYLALATTGTSVNPSNEDPTSRATAGSSVESWFGASVTDLESRVGDNGTPDAQVRAAKFVLSQDQAARVYTLFTDLNMNAEEMSQDADASLGESTSVPAPGAIALLGLAGLAGGRRRR